MSKVPAWKRLGLQVKGDADDSPLHTTTHLEHDTVTNKLAKKLNKKRKQETSSEGEQKKPPKRVKLPKLERKPPPEKDQLLYLRQYATDKDNWKFSKQKQNWILKNISDIPPQYEDALVVYVEGLQGGARDRLVPELTKVIQEWNEVAQKLEDKVNAELYGTSEEKKEDQEEKKEEKEEVSGPLKEYAVRCKRLLKAINDEDVELKGMEEDVDTKVSEEQKDESEEETPADTETSEQTPEQKPASETPEEPSEEDNLVFDDIEVEDYQYTTQEEDSSKLESEESSLGGDASKKELKKKSKKEKKEKKEKKKAKRAD